MEEISRAGDLRLVPHLIPLLKDPDPFVRRVCAEVLGTLGAPAAAEPLIGALADEEPIVRDAAYRSLRRLTGETFPFDPEAPPARRAEGIARWQGWWRQHGRRFAEGG